MIVRAKESTILVFGGKPRAVRKGEPYDDNDALVRAFPDAFVSDVERATSAPGERRTVRVPKK